MRLAFWVLAAKSNGFAATIVPTLVGSALALSGNGATAWDLWGIWGFAAALIQAGTLLVQSAAYGDRQADSTGQIWPPRTSQESNLKTGVLHLLGVLCLVGALMQLRDLIAQRGLPLLLTGLWCSVMAFTYSGGISDAVVLTLSGAVMTSAAHYMHRGMRLFVADSFAAGLQVGCLAGELALANSVTDLQIAAEAGRIPLAQTSGAKLPQTQVVVQIMAAYVAGFIYWLLRGSLYIAALPLLSLPIAALVIQEASRGLPRESNNLVVLSGVLHLLFGVLLSTAIGTSGLTFP